MGTAYTVDTGHWLTLHGHIGQSPLHCFGTLDTWPLVDFALNWHI